MPYAACLAWPELPWTTDTADLDRAGDPAALASQMSRVCRGCPVRLACAAYAEHHNITGGWWAGDDRDPDAHPTLPGTSCRSAAA